MGTDYLFDRMAVKLWNKDDKSEVSKDAQLLGLLHPLQKLCTEDALIVFAMAFLRDTTYASLGLLLNKSRQAVWDRHVKALEKLKEIHNGDDAPEIAAPLQSGLESL